ncbi:mediator of RNA polymerase II transcription subunit 27 isoform X2 [Cherax quadricarinatus]
MAAMEGLNVDTLTVTLNTLRTLRSSATLFFKIVSEGAKEDNLTEGQNNFSERAMKVMADVKTHLRELETQVAGLSPPSNPVNLGNTGLLSLDPTPDKLPLYYQLLDCYTWMEKVHCYSTIMHSLFSGNNLKRSSISSPYSAKRRRPVQLNHNVPQQQVDGIIQSINQMFPDMTLNLSRPFGNNAVVQVDLYTSSQYKVFQKVTDNANAAMLNFCSSGFSDLAVRSFFTWLHSFVSLFTDVCKRCNNHLHNHMPPTWREFRTLDPFHEECKA